MSAEVTKWFNVVEDGNPGQPGWYEVLYAFEPKDIHNPSRFWWDGVFWRFAPESKGTSSFGNYEPQDDHWRGLAEKPE